MKNPTIILTNGVPLDLDNFKTKVFGYRIVHKETGRILPGTSRNEIYSKAAGIRKMNQVASAFNVMQAPLDIWQYNLQPIYDFEIPKEYNYIIDENDNVL